MQKIKFLIGALALAAMVSSGCQEENDILSQDNNLVPEVTSLFKANPRPQTWVDGELFAGVVTPATFDPSNGNFDELYHGVVGQDGSTQGGGFSMGVPLISESKPGDQDYNGGRWHLNILKSGVAADKYASATGVGDLDLADFVSTNKYFECPLLPRSGKGPPS